MKEKNKIFIIALGMLIAFTLPVFPGGSDQFDLNLKTDLILLGAGGLTALTGMLSITHIEEPNEFIEGWQTWPSFPYNEKMEYIGDVLLVAGMAGIPFLMDSWTRENVVTLGVIYIEAMSFSWGLKESLKAVYPKYRPFVSHTDTPADLMNDDDHYCAFPSGHTAIAFTTAGFATTIFAASEAPGWVKGVFTGANFTTAAVVGVLRITSGTHYLVDVLTGALIGTVSGILIPLFHKNKQDTNIALRLNPSVASLSFSY